MKGDSMEQLKKNNQDLSFDSPDLEAPPPYETPVGEIEKELTRIWSGALKIEKICRHDNFFELGGNSLLAAKIIYNIHEIFGMELPVRKIFELQTVKALAEEINNIYEEVLGDEIDEGII